MSIGRQIDHMQHSGSYSQLRDRTPHAPPHRIHPPPRTAGRIPRIGSEPRGGQRGPSGAAFAISGPAKTVATVAGNALGSIIGDPELGAQIVGAVNFVGSLFDDGANYSTQQLAANLAASEARAAVTTTRGTQAAVLSELSGRPAPVGREVF